MRRRSVLWLLMIVATVLFVVGVWTNAIPLLRGPDEWSWTLRTLTQPIWRLLLPLVLLALYALVAARWIGSFPPDSSRSSRRVAWSFLFFLTIAAPLIQVALAAAVWHAPLFEFFAATTSPSVTGFHSVAVTTPELPAYLSRYADFMQTLPIHPQTHPPGLVLLHWLAWQGFAATPDLANSLAMPLRTLQCQNAALMTFDNAQLASSVAGMIIPIIGGFAVWPLYALGCRLSGARQAALAAAIFPVLPMFVMWPAQPDQVFPLLLLIGLYFIHTGLEARSIGRFLSAGIVLSFATFLSFGNLVMVVIAGLYLIVWWVTQAAWRDLMKGEAVRRWGGQLLALAAGVATMWLIYIVAYRVPLGDLAMLVAQSFSEATRCPICPSTQRTYNVWVAWNVVDFAIFLSLPVTILLLARLPALLATSYAAVCKRSGIAWAPLTVAALLTFVVLDLAGIVRGEVSRLWSYFGPLFILLALSPVKGIWPAKRTGVAVFISLIALQLFSMNTRWYTYPSFMDEPPVREASFTTPQPQVAANIDFAQQIKLVGADLKNTGGSLELNLYWQALMQPPHAYTVFVHVLDKQGNLIVQQDNMPVHDQLLTSCWQPGERVSDPYSVALPAPETQPASIEVGLYRLDTGERLIRDDGAGTTWLITLNPH